MLRHDRCPYRTLAYSTGGAEMNTVRKTGRTTSQRCRLRSYSPGNGSSAIARTNGRNASTASCRAGWLGPLRSL